MVYETKNILGMWWYRLSDERLEFSTKATFILDQKAFPLAEIFKNGKSDEWVSGRVIRINKKVYVVVYSGDTFTSYVRGSLAGTVLDRIKGACPFPIDGIMDSDEVPLF